MVRFFDRIEEYILIILFPLMTLIVFAATVSRYLNLVSMPWSEELARYIMAWMAYIGASLGVKRSAHLGVEVIVNLFPERLKKFAGILRVVIILLFNVLVIMFSYKIIMHQIKIEQLSPAMGIPIWVAYLSVPVGSFMMCIRSIQIVIKQNTSKEE
ncbi:TRAP transporter small permease [Clostridium aestuarii]|uniref:TRAP transporter small permease n=1 Tax=Clostridium aestuarii TaxID=338193 RepID=A0ABT4CYR6_9CLOT|nr:TRAP transporter small permease [Clostridium aestuarii]MCY6484131.1 TRAP transporter small permease [Clostridium aestuarii]